MALSTSKSAPCFYKRGKTGILLVHGFTSTPYVFRDIIRQLAEQNYTVSAPLLAGHGTSPEDLEPTTWQDWYQSVEDAYKELKDYCDEVLVVGVSFGANLSCLLAVNHKINGLILIGMPRWIYRHWLAVFFTPIFLLLGIRYFKKSVDRLTDSNELIGGPNYSYFKIPVKSVKQFFDFLQNVNDGLLKKVTVPTLMIQSDNDGLVQPKSGRYIFEKIASTHKELIWISEPHHELHSPVNRERIYGYVTDFMVRWK